MRDYHFGVARRLPVHRALFVVMASLALAACGQGDGGQAQGGGGQQQPPTPVQVKTLQPHQVDVYAEYPGRVEGKQTARIIGRVTGVLLDKNYREGSIVHKGDRLFTIDPKPYQATVNQRKAELSSAQASLANSRRIWNRTKKLYDSNAVSQAERDQALSNYDSDRASVQQAKANLDSAQIDLGYTHVEAPITGVTSLRDIDLGSLVTANQTQLTTITQLDPVYVLFALPEDDAFARRKALSDMGKESSDASTREATILLNNGQPFPYKAQVDFTQSTIDPDTGTVQLRAVVKNPNNELMPGRYVRTRLRIQTLDKALTVPDSAISDSGQQVQVFVARNGKAQTQAVKLGPNTSDGRVISSGLKPGDKVIVSGIGSLQSGAPIKIQQGAGNKNGDPASNGGAQSSGDASGGGSGGQSGQNS
ncbi:efflux RND transporter periplasmic adaptor subunit [Salinisphaera sp. Q1T1-3]|uniref:efflux RND transporter periplasmic adaptor subunit n=1 Tax=Salinisphaera sp. Q1T1-3 TaxID=2321229 RepID=UPI000E736250|nr:efflux RND transporter periplasmic adaptor subunit [Salinisphaera sp. Q1T1-3]RJS94368.1 efflux RND transporter periplasmic adaptor subunit [Salinisphaera sp. Q1T1-3]